MSFHRATRAAALSALLTAWPAAGFAEAQPPAGSAADSPAPGSRQQARLVARSVLSAASRRAGSPASGAYLSPADRETASRNGVGAPRVGPLFAEQPVQGISSMVPGERDSWWALADNGYAWRGNSADWQLAIYRLDPRWGEAAGPRLLETVVLRDPDRKIPWTIVCDPRHGDPLPDLSFNVLPPPPAACGRDAAARLLTGFDFDPESFVRAPDGTFWIGDEFGPFLLHVAADGRLLEEPIEVEGVRSPQSPWLGVDANGQLERPTLASSRGFEGLAISPDGGTLWALLEGAVAGDDPQQLRVYLYRTGTGRFDRDFLKLALEGESQVVDLAALVRRSGARHFPEEAAPPRGGLAIGELKAVDDRRLLLVERDNLGDDERAPAFKKIFLLDTANAAARDGFVEKAPLLDLLAIPDPDRIGGDADFFALPFYTIESVHVVDDRTLLVASDNNFPFSNGRARSRAPGRAGPLAADDSEMILVRLGKPLSVDPRLLPRP